VREIDHEAEKNKLAKQASSNPVPAGTSTFLRYSRAAWAESDYQLRKVLACSDSSLRVGRR
jgi:hypothetical protein